MDLVLSHVDVIDLSQVVLVDASLQTDPLAGPQPDPLLDDPHHVGHLLDGDHLLGVLADPQAGDACKANDRGHQMLVEIAKSASFVA